MVIPHRTCAVRLATPTAATAVSSAARVLAPTRSRSSLRSPSRHTTAHGARGPVTRAASCSQTTLGAESNAAALRRRWASKQQATSAASCVRAAPPNPALRLGELQDRLARPTPSPRSCSIIDRRAARARAADPGPPPNPQRRLGAAKKAAGHPAYNASVMRVCGNRRLSLPVRRPRRVYRIHLIAVCRERCFH